MSAVELGFLYKFLGPRVLVFDNVFEAVVVYVE